MFQKSLKTIVSTTKNYLHTKTIQKKFYCSKTITSSTKQENNSQHLDQRLLNYVATLQNDIKVNKNVTNGSTSPTETKNSEFRTNNKNLHKENEQNVLYHNQIEKCFKDTPELKKENETPLKGTKSFNFPFKTQKSDGANQNKIQSVKGTPNLHVNIINLKNSSNFEFLALLKIILTQNSSNFHKNLIEIDNECCRRLPNLNQVEIFSILNNFSSGCPYYVRDLKFFSAALKKLGFSINRFDKPEIIQLAYYAGLLKKNQSSQKTLKFILNKFNNKKVLRSLTLDDIIILTNSAFKTSTRISQNFILDEIRIRLTNCLDILKDEPYFITLVKSLRHNFNYDEELLITLALAMSFNKMMEKYNFTALGHIFTLYADALFNDPVLIENFTKFSLKQLRNPILVTEKSHFSKNLRPKDLSRFLYSISYLGSDFLKNDDFETVILPLIEKFVNLGLVEKHVDDFLSIFLSLWILGYWDEKILLECLKEKLVSKGRQKNAFSSRLNILLTSIQIEEPLIFEKLKLRVDPGPNFNLGLQIEKRPYLVKIFDALKTSMEKYDCGSMEYTYAVPHLNIVGISMFDRNRKVLANVECIDESNCTKYVEIVPHGYMKLKLRLLKAIKKPLLVVDKETIEDMENTELIKYLDKKLKIAIYLNNR